MSGEQKCSFKKNYDPTLRANPPKQHLFDLIDILNYHPRARVNMPNSLSNVLELHFCSRDMCQATGEPMSGPHIEEGRSINYVNNVTCAELLSESGV